MCGVPPELSGLDLCGGVVITKQNWLLRVDVVSLSWNKWLRIKNEVNHTERFSSVNTTNQVYN